MIFQCYLLHLSKVRRLRNGPSPGILLRIHFAKTAKTWAYVGCSKTGAKKNPPPDIYSLSEDLEGLPRAPGFGQ